MFIDLSGIFGWFCLLVALIWWFECFLCFGLCLMVAIVLIAYVWVYC